MCFHISNTCSRTRRTHLGPTPPSPSCPLPSGSPSSEREIQNLNNVLFLLPVGEYLVRLVEQFFERVLVHLDVELLDQGPDLVEGQGAVLVLVGVLELLLEEPGKKGEHFQRSNAFATRHFSQSPEAEVEEII